MPATAELQKLMATAEPPELGPQQRAGIQTQSQLNSTLDACFTGAQPLTKTNRELIRALILLWHDHLEAAHVIAQNIENADGAFVHGIMHRREPDYGNAKYWFRRVGKHPAFGEIARRASELLNNEGEGRLDLLPAGEWDPFAFVDACERASRRGGTEQERRLLRQIQAIESTVLLERLFVPEAT